MTGIWRHHWDWPALAQQPDGGGLNGGLRTSCSIRRLVSASLAG